MNNGGHRLDDRFGQLGIKVPDYIRRKKQTNSDVEDQKVKGSPNNNNYNGSKHSSSKHSNNYNIQSTNVTHKKRHSNANHSLSKTNNNDINHATNHTHKPSSSRHKRRHTVNYPIHIYLVTACTHTFCFSMDRLG